LTGAGLQLTTVIALTIAFGIAVDDTVHFLSHYLHSRRDEGMTHIDAVRHTLNRIGGAIVATTIILCSGVIIVTFSELPQVALFGTLFVSTLAFAVVGDLFILPALLAAGGKFFEPLGRIGVRMADEDPTPDDPTADTHTTVNGKPNELDPRPTLSMGLQSARLLRRHWTGNIARPDCPALIHFLYNQCASCR